MTVCCPAGTAPLRPHDVYVAYAADGTCLYVGVSTQLERRLASHARQAAWWAAKVQITTERMDDCATGYRRERDLIHELHPLHNQIHSFDNAITKAPPLRHGAPKRYGCHQYAKHTSGRDLAADVAALRAGGSSWRAVRDQVAKNTGGKVAVSHESLRTWFGRPHGAVA